MTELPLHGVKELFGDIWSDLWMMNGPEMAMLALVIGYATLLVYIGSKLWKRKAKSDRILYVVTNDDQEDPVRIETKIVQGNRVIYEGSPPSSEVFLSLLLSLRIQPQDVYYYRTNDIGLEHVLATLPSLKSRSNRKP